MQDDPDRNRVDVGIHEPASGDVAGAAENFKVGSLVPREPEPAVDFARRIVKEKWPLWRVRDMDEKLEAMRRNPGKFDELAATLSKRTRGPDSSATFFRSRSTVTVAQHRTSSAGSDEINKIDIPLLARFKINLQISAFAPTSTPRVGSSKIKARGFVASHLPITSFC